MIEEAILHYENTIEATFVRRVNRFTSIVRIDGEEEAVHVKNTGRLGELLLPDARVCLQKAGNPNRKTAYDLISVYKEGLQWVNIDSLAPNMLMKQVLAGAYDLVKPEFKYGNSRVDFYMEKDGEKYLREVKGCTLAVDIPQGIGMFPDAPTERGVKHLKELTEAVRAGYHGSIAFVISMNGITKVIPNDIMQPEFGQALREAAASGVQILCYSCRVEADRICVEGMLDVTDRLRQE